MNPEPTVVPSTMPLAEGGFLAELESSRLVTADKLRAFVAEQQSEQLDDRAWAERLVNAHVISALQATRVLQGRWRELFFGNYRAVHKLHDGGVGLVFLAQHRDQPGWFAIKTLKPTRRDTPAAVDMFRLEALALTTLRHPNIVRGLEYLPQGDDPENGHFLAMEFVRGPNLAELVAIKNKLPVGQVCDIIMQAAEGLEFAHQQHFLHRDVKPANLIVDRDGVTKLIDFGFARYTGSQEPFPIARTHRPGTLGFYAPEALHHDRARDRRSDIYSLGVTFYFALTGVAPFQRATKRETLAAQKLASPQPIRELRDDVPSEVASIVERMLASEADDRFATMAEVLEALRPFAERHAVQLSMRALLRARARIQPRDFLVSSAQASKPSVGVPAEERDAESTSELRTLEAFVRRIADQLTAQRAENLRLCEELEQLRSQRSELERQQAEQLQLREELRQTRDQAQRVMIELSDARGTIESLSNRCVDLEALLVEYKRQIFEITLRAGELSEPAGLANPAERRGNDKQQALRVAYEQAMPAVEPTENADSFDEIFADDSLLREIAHARWSSLR